MCVLCLESLAHFVCLKRLGVVIKYAAHKKSRNIRLYLRPVLITKIRISKYIAHLRNREINNVAEQSGFGFFLNLLLSCFADAGRDVHYKRHYRNSATELVIASFDKAFEDRIISLVHRVKPKRKDRQVVRVAKIAHDQKL